MKKRVLIVDDSEREVRQIAALLRRAGYEVLTAADGSEGINLARQEMPDVILMDIVMPVLNGFQATRQLTSDAQTRDIPVVILSAKDEEIDRVWALRQGARAYLCKGREQKNLVRTLDQVMAG